MSLLRLLIVEPEVPEAALWCESLRRDGFECVLSTSGREAMARLWAGSFDAMIIDLGLTDTDPREVMAAARRRGPRTAIVAVAAGANALDGVVEIMRLGAADYFAKPVEPAALAEALRRAHDRIADAPADSDAQLVGNAESMCALREIVRQVADSNATVLIYGESGTGKELVARSLHASSPRKDQPFVAINCAAIPENLLESELFGHVRGAFTGASAPRIGRFELAHNGTLFLDEIGDMPLQLQVKLLRVLQERVIEPVGGSRSVKVDVRIIAATHCDLDRLVEIGRFRSDLYYRLNVIPLMVPSLRERPEDIPELCLHFLAKVNRERNGFILGISDEALQALQAYPWPGNVRELENLIERLVVVKRRGMLTLADLPPRYLGLHAAAVQVCAQPPVPKAAPELPESGVDLRQALAALETQLIHQALARSGGNKNRAATLLGLNRTTLVEKLKRMREEVAA